jgi:hypothetical protein
MVKPMVLAPGLVEVIKKKVLIRNFGAICSGRVEMTANLRVQKC